MTDADLIKIKKRAIAYASKRKFERDAEDFAQECMLYAFKHSIINIEWCFADYLRRAYGDTRTPGGKQKSIGRLTALSLDAPVDSSDPDSGSLHSLLGSTDTGPECQFIDNRIAELIKQFDGRSQMIVDSILSGRSSVDIVEELGVSASRVSQIKNKVLYLLQILIITPDSSKAWVIKHAF